MVLRFLLLGVFVLNITILPGQSPGNGVSVKGRVMSQSGEAVPFAVVYLSNNKCSAVTDSEGNYEIKNIPPDTYAINVQCLGYQQAERSIVVLSAKELICDFELQPQSIGLQNVLVTAKSNVTKAREQAFNVSVIDVAPMQARNLDISQALGKSTGIKIREEGGVGSGYSFSLNGFSGKQVKFFLDGIPMDNFGPSMGINNIPANLAERIEVYKGVLPVSLGADALGGAVNIVTRKALNYLDATYTTGSFNTHKVSVNNALSNELTGLTLRSNLFYNYSDNNYRIFVPVLDLETGRKGAPQWVERFHDRYQSAGIKMEGGITNKSFADYLLAGVLVSGNRKAIQNGVTMESVFGNITSASYSVIPSIRYHKKNLFFDGLNATAGVTFNKSVYHYMDTVPRRYNWLGQWVPKASATAGEYRRSQLTNNDREWIANANVEYSISRIQSVSLNYVFSRLNRDVADKEDPDNVEYLIPQQIEKQIAGLGYSIVCPRWNFSLLGKYYVMQGTSYEYVDQFTEDERLSRFTTNYAKPGFGAAFTWFIIDNLQTKVSFEQTYRLPEGTEMFGNGLFIVRNPDLEPEKSSNYNLNVSYAFTVATNHAVDVEAGALYRDTRDYIQKELQDPSTRFINLGNVLTTGVDGVIRYRWKSTVRASAAITYQDIIDNMEYVVTTGYVGAGKTKNLTYNDRLPNIPYLFGNADLGVTLPGVFHPHNELMVDYALNYVHEYFLSWPSLGSKSSKSMIPSQMSHTISIGYSLQDKRYQLTLECSNLTNEKLYDNYLLQKPGRAFYVKLRFNV